MPRLFTPLALGPLELPNRIIVAPMCQYSASDGLPADWHLMHYGTLALSGAGMLIVEATGVTPEGRISPADLGLWSEAHQAAFARLIGAIRRHSAMPLAIQLAHAGRKGSSRAPWDGGSQIRPDEPGGWRTLAPSALPHADGETPPEALDAAGLARLRDAFASAARRAVDAGFEAIELHGAHGYLLHQFLSPLANRREDDYGGCLANRMRFPLEVFDAVRAAVPAGVPVWMRVSATDWVEGGWDLDGTITLANELRARGAVAIHVSSGGVSPRQQIPLGPGYQLPHARRVREETGLPTVGVGLVTDPEQAEQALADGAADAIALARAMLFDPRWPWHAAARLGARVVAPPQYWRCQPRELKDLFTGATNAQR